MKTPAAGLIVALLAAPLAAGESWRSIVPWPREIRVIEPCWPLAEGAVIVIDDVPLVRIGADEINRRIAELGGQPLGVVMGEPAAGAPLVLRVAAGGGAGAETTADDGVPPPPRPQGYSIRFRTSAERREVLLAGTDPMGALYACVSFRYLLDRSREGLTLTPVVLRDWPDFPWRGSANVMFLTNGLAETTDEARSRIGKELVDWCLRRKINVLHDLAHFRPGDPAKSLAWVKDVNDYARQRGFLSLLYQSTAIASADTAARNDLSRCALLDHGHYFTWADEAALSRRAKTVAAVAAMNGFNLLALHPPDDGGPLDPSLWSRRSAFDRQKWRDEQRAEADALVMNLFYREARALQPQLRVAYTIYPYNARYLDYEFLSRRYPALTREALQRNVIDYWRQMEERIPRDVYVVVWNGPRDLLTRFRTVFGGRDLFFWSDFAGRWNRQPLFVGLSRYLGDSHFPDQADVLSAMHDRVQASFLELLGTAEHGWNTSAPGSQPFTGRYFDLLADARPAPEIRDSLLPRAARNLWGDRLGPLMAGAFTEGISAALLVAPSRVIEYENRQRRYEGRPALQVTEDMLAAQRDALERVLPGLERAFGECPAAESLARDLLVYYYRRLRVLRLVAAARLARARAERLAAAGEGAAAAGQLERGLTFLRSELPRLRAMAEQTAKLTRIDRRFHDQRQADVFSVLTQADLDFAVLMREMAGLLTNVKDAPGRPTKDRSRVVLPR